MSVFGGLGRLFAGAALALAVAGAAFAQGAEQPNPEQVKAARDVVEASGAVASLRDAVQIYIDEGKQQFSRTQPGLAADLDQCVKILTPEFQGRYEQLLDGVAQVYARRFTAQELQDLKAFYTSPTGRKLVESQASLISAVRQVRDAWTQRMSHDVVTRFREEMKKKGHDI